MDLRPACAQAPMLGLAVRRWRRRRWMTGYRDLFKAARRTDLQGGKCSSDVLAASGVAYVRDGSRIVVWLPRRKGMEGFVLCHSSRVSSARLSPPVHVAQNAQRLSVGRSRIGSVPARRNTRAAEGISIRSSSSLSNKRLAWPIERLGSSDHCRRRRAIGPARNASQGHRACHRGFDQRTLQKFRRCHRIFRHEGEADPRQHH